MAFQCFTTCSNFIIISQTEYSFLSQQSGMSVHKRAGFLTLTRHLNWFGTARVKKQGHRATAPFILAIVLCIIRQPLKYLCFRYSFLIIIFINCNWVVTRWQWLFYMYTNMKKKVTRKFKSGGLHEKHVVATWKLGNHLSIRL